MENFFSTQLPNNLLETMYAFGLKFFGALGFVHLAWILIRFIVYGVRKSLMISKADSKFENLQRMMNITFEINLANVIIGFVKWGLIMILITIGVDILDFTVISTEIGKIIQYFPKLV